MIRFLDREAEITTRFGGGFVHSIDGIEGEIADGRSSDWFFFVNGIESSIAAPPRSSVRGGDRIWWDYRDWTDAMRAPAVVGSWPEPFAQASTPEAERARGRRSTAWARRRPATRSARGSRRRASRSTTRGAGDAAAPAPGRPVGPGARRTRSRRQLDDGPAASGVFARLRAPAAAAGA